jgi:hypothetical protein
VKVAKDLSGQVFGDLTVLTRYQDNTEYGVIQWACVCSCGQITTVLGMNLKSGRTKSCGCKRVKHGLSHTPEYDTWTGMKQRCFNPETEGYSRYGGRGITVCERWKDSVENFIQDMGPRPGPEYSIERKEVDGDYEPNNCYWATMDIQQNNRRNNLVFTHDGQTRTLAQWSRHLGIPYTRLHTRLFVKKWSFEDAIQAGKFSRTGQLINNE